MELEVCSAGRGGESGHPWSHASSNPRSAQPGQSASGRQCRQLVTVPTLLPCPRHAVGKHRPGPRARRISPGLFFLGFRDPRPSPFPPVLPPPLQLPPFSPPPQPPPRATPSFQSLASAARGGSQGKEIEGTMGSL